MCCVWTNFFSSCSGTLLHATTRHPHPAGVTGGLSGAQRHPSAWRFGPHPNAPTQRRYVPAPRPPPPTSPSGDKRRSRRPPSVGGGTPPVDALSVQPSAAPPYRHRHCLLPHLPIDSAAKSASGLSVQATPPRRQRRAAQTAVAAAELVADQPPPRRDGGRYPPKDHRLAGGRVRGTEGGEGEGGPLNRAPSAQGGGRNGTCPPWRRSMAARRASHPPFISYTRRATASVAMHVASTNSVAHSGRRVADGSRLRGPQLVPPARPQQLQAAAVVAPTSATVGPVGTRGGTRAPAVASATTAAVKQQRKEKVRTFSMPTHRNRPRGERQAGGQDVGCTWTFRRPTGARLVDNAIDGLDASGTACADRRRRLGHTPPQRPHRPRAAAAAPTAHVACPLPRRPLPRGG